MTKSHKENYRHLHDIHHITTSNYSYRKLSFKWEYSGARTKAQSSISSLFFFSNFEGASLNFLGFCFPQRILVWPLLYYWFQEALMAFHHRQRKCLLDLEVGGRILHLGRSRGRVFQLAWQHAHFRVHSQAQCRHKRWEASHYMSFGWLPRNLSC